MWIGFGAALVAAVALLYVPGYLFWRGLRLSHPLALCCAPLFGVFVYATLPIVYYELGVPCSVATVALPALLAGVLCFAIRVWTARGSSDVIELEPQRPVRVVGRTVDFDLAVLVAYIAVATLVCLWMFVSNLPRPDTFFSRYDNQTHLNLVRAFLDSGKWSTLHANVFLASVPEACPLDSTTSGFYPAAFHDLTSLVCLLTSTSVMVVTNAVVVVVFSITIPAGLYLLARVLLQDNRAAVMAGAVVSSASVILPWTFVLKGPTWPDMIANSLVPAFVAIIMIVVNRRMVRTHLATFAVFCVCSLGTLALMHPNSVFTAYVFCCAYGAHAIWHATQGRRRLVALTAFVVAATVAWILFHFAPMLQSTLNYKYVEHSGYKRALGTLALLSFGRGKYQPVLALGLLAGAWCCVRNRRVWLLFVPAFFGACYVATRVGQEFVKYWLAGFWYTNPYRFATRLITFAIPIMAMGFVHLAGLLYARVARGGSHALARRVTAASVLACCIVNFVPLTTPITTAYGRVHTEIHNIYTDQIEHVYSEREIAFVNRAMEAMPQGALVLNFPNDGTMWSYAVNGLNTYFRDRSPWRISNNAKVIGSSLNQIATNPEVRDIVRRTGAQYLIMLDVGISYEDGVWIPQYYKGDVARWSGVSTIDDNTPGFTVVLAEDDMRLYRID